VKVFACELNLLNSGKAFITDINQVSIGIFCENGQIYAVRNVCPHKSAPVCQGTVGGTMLPSDPCEFQFGLDGEVLKCPWHGWEFSLVTGDALFGISNRKLKTYPVVIEDERVYIEI
jgi:nitrite reductase (NADH) small subunit